MNKLSIFFFALAFLCTGKVTAQIGINNPAPKSTLDVSPTIRQILRVFPVLLSRE